LQLLLTRTKIALWLACNHGGGITGTCGRQSSGGSASPARSESGAPLRRPWAADVGAALERCQHCKHPAVRLSWNGVLSTDKRDRETLGALYINGFYKPNHGTYHPQPLRKWLIWESVSLLFLPARMPAEVDFGDFFYLAGATRCIDKGEMWRVRSRCWIPKPVHFTKFEKYKRPAISFVRFLRNFQNLWVVS